MATSAKKKTAVKRSARADTVDTITGELFDGEPAASPTPDAVRVGERAIHHIADDALRAAVIGGAVNVVDEADSAAATGGNGNGSGGNGRDHGEGGDNESLPLAQFAERSYLEYAM